MKIKLFITLCILNAKLLSAMDICTIDMKRVEIDSLFCIEKRQKLEVSLRNIDTQIQIYQDQKNEPDKNEAEVDKAINKLYEISDSLSCMYDLIIEHRIKLAIEQIMAENHYNLCLDSKMIVLFQMKNDITWLVINRMNMRFINTEVTNEHVD